jgi:F-type H+-transporting ATPase subunit gamma
MSKKSDLKRRLDALEEIKGIMTAMKNLSLVEISKLSRLAATQRETVLSVDEAVSDFLSFYPIPVSKTQEATRESVYLLIGSERGFCGGFNELIIQRLQSILHGSPGPIEPTLMIVGSRLASKLPKDLRVGLCLPGPSAPEEVSDVVGHATRHLEAIQEKSQPPHPGFLTIIHNQESGTSVETRVVRPFARFIRKEAQRYSHPPLLNIPSQDMLVLLADHHLLAALYDVFYSSLMAEHRQRVRHMENAIQHLEKAVTKLAHHVNQLRQEEITEEIEVIMLNTIEPEVNQSI